MGICCGSIFTFVHVFFPFKSISNLFLMQKGNESLNQELQKIESHLLIRKEITKRGLNHAFYILFFFRKGQRGNLKLSTITGHQGHRLDDLSVKGVVALFSHVVLSMFRYLDSHRSDQLVNLFPVRVYLLMNKKKLVEFI